MSDPVLISTGIPNLLPMKGRSPGLHHSTVLSDWMIRSGYWAPKEREEPFSEQSHSPGLLTRMQLGLAFEDILIDRYTRHDPSRYLIPGELDIDGLFITPDLLDKTDGSPDSIKYTWISSGTDILDDKFRYHWMQLKSECIALETDVCRLHICHSNGDYSWLGNSKGKEKNFNPAYNVWKKVFDRSDLENHRSLILRHRDRMIREGWEEKEKG